MPTPEIKGATIYLGGAVVGYDETAALPPYTGGIPDVSVLPEPFTEDQTPGVAATGATAGTPGSWTPAGAKVPATLAECPALTGQPAWTTGQYAYLKDGTSQVHWNGTAWATGVAA